MHDIWQILGIEATKDKKVIKRAYSQLIKKVRPEEQKKEFEKINNAYKTAISLASNSFVQQLDNNYYSEHNTYSAELEKEEAENKNISAVDYKEPTKISKEELVLQKSKSELLDLVEKNIKNRDYAQSFWGALFKQKKLLFDENFNNNISSLILRLVTADHFENKVEITECIDLLCDLDEVFEWHENFHSLALSSEYYVESEFLAYKIFLYRNSQNKKERKEIILHINKSNGSAFEFKDHQPSSWNKYLLSITIDYSLLIFSTIFISNYFLPDSTNNGYYTAAMFFFILYIYLFTTALMPKHCTIGGYLTGLKLVGENYSKPKLLYVFCRYIPIAIIIIYISGIIPYEAEKLIKPLLMAVVIWIWFNNSLDKVGYVINKDQTNYPISRLSKFCNNLYENFRALLFSLLYKKCKLPNTFQLADTGTKVYSYMLDIALPTIAFTATMAYGASKWENLDNFFQSFHNIYNDKTASSLSLLAIFSFVVIFLRYLYYKGFKTTNLKKHGCELRKFNGKKANILAATERLLIIHLPFILTIGMSQTLAAILLCIGLLFTNPMSRTVIVKNNIK